MPSLLSGGEFQDIEGNVLSNGRLTMRLSAPATDAATGTVQLCPGEVVVYALDVNGNAVTPQSIWPNSQLLPRNTYYTITAYSSDGQLSWGPNSLALTDKAGFIVLTNLIPANPA